MGRFVSTLALAMVMCSSVTACINDSELPQHERVFRSQYLETPTPPVPDYSHELPPLVWSGSGVVMLTTAFASVFLRRLRD